MGKGIASAIPSLIGAFSNSGNQTSSSPSGADVAFAGQQEQMKLKSAYADMGIPFSSGLAYDLGSIPFQEAAQNAQIAQNTQGNQNQQFAQLGNALGGLNLGGQNPSTNTSTTNTDLTNPNLTGTV